MAIEHLVGEESGRPDLARKNLWSQIGKFSEKLKSEGGSVMRLDYGGVCTIIDMDPTNSTMITDIVYQADAWVHYVKPVKS